ncbi:DUF6542 domain-containing protein [Nocardioides alcanivorans]|uniref:DUF6542 domain-containing protein n=1 Tax=Nocardioides alcanivorans TaxID=2897352 RepID=UPI001F333FEF|nr:DUF6542 domain-containing protein [Nocardioides alcanivorans]
MARARTIWEEGDEPARSVATLGVAVAVSLLLVDLLVTSSVSVLFDIGFVLLCIILALRVRRDDFTLVGVLPPALMVGTFWLHALFVTDESTAQALIRTLSEHVGALVAGYVLFLGLLWVRHEFLRRRRRDPRQPVG